MPKQSKNPLWDYFKISYEDVRIAVCILCKKNLSRWSKDPHKMTTTTNLFQSFSQSFGTSLIVTSDVEPLKSINATSPTASSSTITFIFLKSKISHSNEGN